MMSPEFMRKLQELRQQRLRTQDFQKWKAANPTSPTGEGRWNAAPWTGQTAQTLVYDTTNGKAFPNPQAALSAGVNNFSYQIPSGMTVDWSYWDQFRQPPPPAPKPVRPITVTDQTVLPGPNPAPPPDTASAPASEEPAPEEPALFQMTDQARRFADAGMFGRAKGAVEAAGGTWDKGMHRQLKADAGSNKNYGGDFKNQSTINSILDKASLVTDATKDGEISYKVPMGKAKKAYEAKHGKGAWSKEVHVAVAAAQKRREKSNKGSRT